MTERSLPRIVIIGAGMAGLSAAHKLVISGLSNVTVLEAADRIGGRIHTIQFGDGQMPVELGAAWIHGSGVDNSSFQLAESIGALRPYRIWNRMSGTFLREDGTEIDRETIDDGLSRYKRMNDKAQRTIADEIAIGNKEKAKYGVVLEKLMDEELEQYGQTGQKHSDLKRLYHVFLNYAGVHEGDDLNKVAFEFPDTSPVKPGGDFHVPSGYESLLDHLVTFLPPGCIQLKSEVINIDWMNRSDEIKVKTGNGNTISAAHVIVTCSLGVLKRYHNTLFTPSLPLEKIDVIKSIGFGCVNKILLEFDEQVLDLNTQNILFSWDDISIKDMKVDWIKRILGFDKIYEKKNVLLGWVYGDAAIHMETLQEAEIASTCSRLLRMFLGVPDFPEPKRTLVSRWSSNPYTHGSYSFQTPDLIPNEQNILSNPLTAPSGVPVVLFAGEATHQENYSCTHGARDSGIREANTLLKLY